MKKLLPMLLLMLLSPLAYAQDETTAVTEASQNPKATIHTSMGDIQLELFPQEAPATVANFIQYAKEGHYNGTIFHRVISYFMIQGGGMTPDMQPKPTRDPIVNEADNGLKNVRGTVAMARTDAVNSATSQFFINVEVNGSLDHTGKLNSRTWGYTVFAKVIQGMDVVDEIRFVEVVNDVPTTPVIIESVEIEE